MLSWTRWSEAFPTDSSIREEDHNNLEGRARQDVAVKAEALVMIDVLQAGRSQVARQHGRRGNQPERKLSLLCSALIYKLVLLDLRSLFRCSEKI